MLKLKMTMRLLTDQMHDLDVDDQSAVGASENTSSFTSHVGHKLSKEELDNLTRRKWKYNWEMPAFDMSSCKWMGTGESFLKVYLSFVLFTCLMSFYCLRIHLQHSLF